MVEDEKLAIDESRKVSQHEAIKGQVRKEVGDEITRTATAQSPGDQSKVETLAEGLKQKAMSEVASTEIELDRARAVARISQVVDYVFCLIYGVIGVEILLYGLGARPGSGFKQFMDRVSSPPLRPFRGLMPDPSRGPFRLMLSYIMALAMYLLLHLAVNGLLRIFTQRKTTV